MGRVCFFMLIKFDKQQKHKYTSDDPSVYVRCCVGTSNPHLYPLSLITCVQKLYVLKPRLDDETCLKNLFEILFVT